MKEGSEARPPRIVNLVFFLRGQEPRGEVDLLEPLVENLRLLEEHDLPATFLVQYDALQQERFVSVLKGLDPKRHEVGVWLEMVRPLVEKAGCEWRGRWDWDWHSDVDFPIGYTPAERRRIADVLMADFRAIFGHHPRSVGSWVLDAPTLGYLADRYGVVAACNCKDQWGTDGYTLWGGYWNGAYFPSRRNAFMPAQTAAGQIRVPIFRMLGSDPIYQYDLHPGAESQGVVTLEPVYSGKGGGGGDPKWVDWFLDVTLRAPCLGFGYAQAGQENSFGWPAMKDGMAYQTKALSRAAARGLARVETLEASGRWFRSRYGLTPATAVCALNDWKGEGRSAVWYDSRYYRAGLVWEGEGFRVRDLHRFDEGYEERYLGAACTTAACTYDTLPVLDGYLWSDEEREAGMRFVEVGAEGERTELACAGKPAVAASEAEEELRVTWRLKGGGQAEVVCRPEAMSLRVVGRERATEWALEMAWSGEKASAVRGVMPSGLVMEHEGLEYEVPVANGTCSQRPGESAVVFAPVSGHVALRLSG